MNSGVTTPQSDPNRDSPWRFLEALEEDRATDRELLELTRADDLEIIGDMVATSRVSLLYAFSGNGKSSLIHAGLIPRFRRRRGYAVFKTRPRPPWSSHDPASAFKDCVLRDIEPSFFLQREMQKLRELQSRASALDGTLSREMESVLESFTAKLARFQHSSLDSQEFVDSLRTKMDLPLVQFVAEIQKNLGAETRFLFVCDQFEELFVHYQNTPEADRFVQELGEVWADDSLKVHFLFSMREDWVGSMITFRRAIPEIFASYYRLAPLACRSAATVLKRPLEQRGLAWEEGVVSELLSDLARAYSANQADRFNGINLTPSRVDDPYIELPALQIVADELWRTREAIRRPFTLEHYHSLLDSSTKAEQISGREVSPAQYVLDSYLRKRLDSIPEAEEKREAMEDLRVECLYVLTDRSRHRRALVEKVLAEEVRRLRPSALELEEVKEAGINAAVKPLVENHLVTEHEAPGGEKEFELAHDFAVRSVVQLWRDLDRKRTALLALLRRERERKDAQLAVATDREKRVLRLLKVAPFGAVVGVLALIGTLFLAWRLELRGLETVLLIETLVLTALLAAFAGVALASRRGLASMILLVALAGVNIVDAIEVPRLAENSSLRVGSVRLPASVRVHSSSWPGIECLEIQVLTKTTLRISKSDYYWWERGIITERDLRLEGSNLVQLRNDRNQYALFSSSGGDAIDVNPGFYWLLVKRSAYFDFAFDIESDDVSPAAPRVVALDSLSGGSLALSGTSLSIYGGDSSAYSFLVFCLCLFAVSLGIAALYNFVVLHRMTGGSENSIRVGRVLLAESIDVPLVLAIMAGLVTWINQMHFRGASPWLLLFIPFGTILLKATLLRWRRTPGLALAGLGIISREDTRPRFTSLLVRELLFVIWSVCNLAFGIPTLLMTPFIVRLTKSHQNFYDTWARTRLVAIEATHTRTLRAIEEEEREGPGAADVA